MSGAIAIEKTPTAAADVLRRRTIELRERKPFDVDQSPTVAS